MENKKESLDLNNIKNSRNDLNIFEYDFDADINLLKKDLLLCYNNEEDLESLYDKKNTIKVSSDNESEINNNPLKEHTINKKNKSKKNKKKILKRKVELNPKIIKYIYIKLIYILFVINCN